MESLQEFVDWIKAILVAVNEFLAMIFNLDI